MLLPWQIAKRHEEELELAQQAMPCDMPRKPSDSAALHRMTALGGWGYCIDSMLCLAAKGTQRQSGCTHRLHPCRPTSRYRGRSRCRLLP